MSDSKSAPEAKQRSRLTVDLPCALDQKLNDLAASKGVTKAELLRHAVSLLSEYDQMQQRGYETGGWKQHADGTREVVALKVLSGF